MCPWFETWHILNFSNSAKCHDQPAGAGTREEHFIIIIIIIMIMMMTPGTQYCGFKMHN